MSKAKANVTEKKPFKAVLPVIIGLILIFGITIGIMAFSGPKPNPKISNPDDIFLTLGNYQITNEKLYYALRSSYSIDELQRFVDKELLKAIEVDRESNEYKKVMNIVIYGVEDLDELDEYDDLDKIKNDFIDTLVISGYHTEADQNDFFDLEYRRYVHARKVYDQDIANRLADGDRAFAISKYQTYYNENYLKEATTIYILFNSEVQAKAVLEKFGVNPKELSSSGWITSAFNSDEDVDDDLNPKIALTDLEVQLAFIDMYNYMYSYYNEHTGDLLVEGVNYVIKTEKDEEDNEIEILEFTDLSETIDEFSQFVFNSTELSAKDSKLQSQIFNTLKLDDSFAKSYTYQPIKLSSATDANPTCFLALKIAENNPVSYVFDYDEDTDEEKIPSEELFKEIEDLLIDELFVDNVIAEKMYDLRRENGLVIYDSVVEAQYKSSYESFYTQALSLSEGQFPAYKVTKAKNKTVLAEFKSNGTKVEFKVDDFFTIMKYKYAVNASFNFMNTHLFLANKEYNEVYNPETKEIYDKKRLKEIVDEQVKMYSYYFALDYFSSQGFPKSYGWKNFLKEFFQAENEYELAVQIAVLSEAKELFAKTFYTYGVTETNTDEKNTLFYWMDKAADEFFSASVINLIVFVDYTNDGQSDIAELDRPNDSNWTAYQKTLAEELADLVYSEEELSKTGKTSLSDQLTQVVLNYNEANFDDPIWGKYKKEGLQLKFETSATYSNSSGIVDEFKEGMRILYKEIEEYGKLGTTLDYPQIGSPFETAYGFHKIALVSTTNYTFKDADKTVKVPTEEDINLYEESLLQDSSTPEEDKIVIETELNNAINTYYTAVLEYFSSDNRISLGLIDFRSEKVENGTIVYADADLKAQFEIISTILRKNTVKALEEGE